MTTIKYSKAVLKYSEDEVYLDIDATVLPANKGCDVSVVYSYDEWRTPRSRNGCFLKNTSTEDSLYRISICVTHLPRNLRIWFALKVVEFKSCGSEHCSWDNNSGINYEVIPEKIPQICLPKESEQTKSQSPPSSSFSSPQQYIPKTQKVTQTQPQIQSHLPPLPLVLPLPLPIPTPVSSLSSSFSTSRTAAPVSSVSPFSAPSLTPQRQVKPQQNIIKSQSPPVIIPPKKQQQQQQQQQQTKVYSQSIKPIIQPNIKIQQNIIQPNIQVVQKPKRSPTLFTPQKQRIQFSSTPTTQNTSLLLPPDFLPDHCITTMLKGHRRMYDEYIY